MSAYTFDVALVVAVTVHADSEAEARASYADAIPNELLVPTAGPHPIVITMSLDDSKDAPDPLVFIDGRTPQGALDL